MASKIEEFLRRFRGGQFQERNVISGEVLPRNIISGRIKERTLLPAPGPVRTGKLPGRDITTTPIDELSAGDLAEFDRSFGGGTTPGRGLERRFPLPTGRQRTTGELLAEERIPTAPGFDWQKFIETAGTLGAALAPQGVFAQAGLTAAGLAREERERGVAATKAAVDLSFEERRTRIAELNTEISQARLDFAVSKDEKDLERALTLEREKSRLRIAGEEAKQPAREAKARKVEVRRGKVETQQRRNRVRTAKNSVMSAIRRHDKGTEDIPQFIGLTPEQVVRVMEIVRKMDITGDETTDEIIQRAVDLLGIETGISGHAEVRASELLGPDEEGADFITNEELLRGTR